MDKCLMFCEQRRFLLARYKSALSITSLLLVIVPTAFGQGTPQETLSKFAVAASKRDFKTVSSLVVGGSSDYTRLNVFNKEEYKDLNVRIRVNSLEIVKNKATVKVTSIVFVRRTTSTYSETVELERQANRRWKIVPPAALQSQGIVAAFSYFSANPKPIPPSPYANGKSSAKKVASKPTKSELSNQRLSNMKDIALALLLYLADNDDNFPKKQSSVWNSIAPYLKVSAVFKNYKSEQNLPLFMNPLLVGNNHVKVVNLAETPMLAWGKPGSLWFDASGYTYVAFCDGHVKRLDKAGAAKLRWNL